MRPKALPARSWKASVSLMNCQAHKVSVIGLYCDYENVTENIKLCRYIKKTYGLPVMVGGPQATALGQILDDSGCDVVSRYEGELTVPELLDYFLDGVGSLDTIKGIMYKKGDESLSIRNKIW